MATFEKERYLGTWYDIQHDFFIYFQWFQSCVMAEYEAVPDSDMISVRNSAYLFGWNGSSGFAVQADNGKDDASLVVELQDGMPSPSDRANYTIMDSDYDTYSIVYSCESIWYGFASWENLWILAREPEISDELLGTLADKIDETLPEYEFWENTIKTVQGEENCSYSDRPTDYE